MAEPAPFAELTGHDSLTALLNGPPTPPTQNLANVAAAYDVQKASKASVILALINWDVSIGGAAMMIGGGVAGGVEGDAAESAAEAAADDDRPPFENDTGYDGGRQVVWNGDSGLAWPNEDGTVTYFHYTTTAGLEGDGLWVDSSATPLSGLGSLDASQGLGIPVPTYEYPITVDPAVTPVQDGGLVQATNKYNGGYPQVFFPDGTPTGSIGTPRLVPPW